MKVVFQKGVEDCVKQQRAALWGGALEEEGRRGRCGHARRHGRMDGDVWALANDDPGIVARSFFREVARGGFSVARSGSRWIFVAFFERLGAFFCLRCLSQTMFTTRAFDVLKLYPAPTAAFILPRSAYAELLTISASVYNCLHCIQNWHCCNDGCHDCQSCNRDDDRRSSTRLAFSGNG